jgi:hypothetical protein
MSVMKNEIIFFKILCVLGIIWTSGGWILERPLDVLMGLIVLVVSFVMFCYFEYCSRNGGK